MGRRGHPGGGAQLVGQGLVLEVGPLPAPGPDDRPAPDVGGHQQRERQHHGPPLGIPGVDGGVVRRREVADERLEGEDLLGHRPGGEPHDHGGDVVGSGAGALGPGQHQDPPHPVGPQRLDERPDPPDGVGGDDDVPSAHQLVDRPPERPLLHAPL